MHLTGMICGNLVKPSDLEDPGDGAFKKSLLRVSIQDGVIEDNLSEIGFGDHLRNKPSGGGNSMARGAQNPEIEQQIKELIHRGKGQTEISRELGLTYHRVDYLVRKLTGKTSVKSALEPVAKPVKKPAREAKTETIPTPESKPERPAFSGITKLREKWMDMHERDLDRAALAARILIFLDGLGETFAADQELAEEVANNGISALERRYNELTGRQVG